MGEPDPGILRATTGTQSTRPCWRRVHTRIPEVFFTVYFTAEFYADTC